MNIKIKKLSMEARLPEKSTEGAAAYDLYIPKETIVKLGRQIIPLDIAIELPYGYEAKIEPRSGFSSKGMEGISLHTAVKGRFDCDVIVGKIDSDYRGNIGVIINNRSNCVFTLPQCTRIAQLTIYKVEDAGWEETEELSDTSRGEGGYGHTGS